MQKHITSRKRSDIYTSEKEYQHFSNFLEDKQSYDLVIDAANYLYPYFPKISKTETGFGLRVKAQHSEALFNTDSGRIKGLLVASACVRIKEGHDSRGKPIMVLSGKRANILRARMMIVKENNTVVNLEEKI